MLFRIAGIKVHLGGANRRRSRRLSSPRKAERLLNLVGRDIRTYMKKKKIRSYRPKNKILRLLVCVCVCVCVYARLLARVLRPCATSSAPIAATKGFNERYKIARPIAACFRAHRCQFVCCAPENRVLLWSFLLDCHCDFNCH